MKIKMCIKSIALLSIALALGVTLIACNRTPADQEAIAPRLKIGVILPLTGKGSEYGQSAREGIEFALKKLAKEGREFELVWENDEFDVKKTVAAYHKLTKIDKVKIIVGPIGSTHTLSIAPLTDNDKILVITPIAGANEATLGHPYVYRIVPKKDNQMTGLANWIRHQGFKNIFAITAQNDSTIGSLEVLEGHIGKIENNFVVPDMHDFRTTLLNAKKINADAIFLNLYTGQFISALRTYKELGIKTPVFSSIIFDSINEINGSKDFVDEMVFVSSRLYTKEFETEFIKATGGAIGTATAYSYDAMIIAAKIADASEPKFALDNIGEIDGALGKYRFNEDGDSTLIAPLKVLRKGKIENLDY